MPVAPDVEALIGRTPVRAPSAATDSPVIAARNDHELDTALFSPKNSRDHVDRVEDVLIPVGGATIRGRLYVPESPRAVLLWFHGGGWVTGSLETADILARAFAARSGLAVLSVEYRLAPEHPWPTPFDDCLASAGWLIANSKQLLGMDGPLLVGGDSAGGNLAAAVALEIRHVLAGQILIYPVVATDSSVEAFPSRVANGTGYHISWEVIEWAIRQYLPNPQDRADRRAAIHLAEDFADLPPAIVVTVEFDPLRDEGRLYSRLLIAADVRTIPLEFDGLVHGSFDMIGSSTTANAAMDSIASQVDTLLSPSTLS